MISAETLENRACSPGRPFCPVQGSQQFESTPAVRADGGTARQGEQLVISAETLENRASSPSRPFRPAQALWKQALEEELGAVFGSRVPVRKAAEHPSQGLSRELAGAVSGSDQASSSVHPREPRRSSRTSCVICSARANAKCSGCRQRLCSRSCLSAHYRAQDCAIRWTEWRSLSDKQRAEVSWETFRSVWCQTVMNGQTG